MAAQPGRAVGLTRQFAGTPARDYTVITERSGSASRESATRAAFGCPRCSSISRTCDAPAERRPAGWAAGWCRGALADCTPVPGKTDRCHCRGFSCSSSKTVEALYEALSADGAAVHFTLTDKYPNLPAFRGLAEEHAGGISYVADSIEATDVPRGLTGVRTLFNAFHHFPPEAGRAVLQSAVAAGQPIAVFEIPERTMATIIPLLVTPLFVCIATPFIRPFHWRRLLWTYVLPLVPLTCWWDGLVSQLRAYTVPELEALASGPSAGAYRWTAGRVPVGATPGHLTYLIGMPRVDG